MPLETASYIASLVATNPTSTDPKSQGDDHLRLVKSTLQNTFAGFPGMVIVTGTEAQGATVNDYTVTVSPAPSAYTSSMLVAFKTTHANTGSVTIQVNALGTKTLLDADGTAITSGDIKTGGIVVAYYDGTSFFLVSGNDRSNRNGDTYTGTHNFQAATVQVATKSANDNSVNAASTAYVDAGVAAEAALRTAADNLEITNRGAADTTLQNNINLKAPINNPTFTGIVTIPAGAVITGYVGSVSPAFTGVPTVPTAAVGTNTTQIASTAFVNSVAFNAALPNQTGSAGLFVTTNGTTASWAGIAPVNITTSQAIVSNQYLVDTSSAALSLTLPASPADGTSIILMDAQDTWATNNVTLISSGGNTINGSSANFTLDVSGAQVLLVYKSTNWDLK